MVERLSPKDLRQIIHIYRMYQYTSVIFHGIVVVLIKLLVQSLAIMSDDFLLDRLSRNAKEQPDKKVFSFIGPGIDGGTIRKVYTYNEIAIESSRLAQHLLSSGLKPGER